jgi:hypothetical protein
MAVLLSGPAICAAAGEPTRIAAGVLTENTRWRGDYLVEGPVKVPSGLSLTIEPGTTVSFAGGGMLAVSGTLLVPGTADRPVSFGPEPASAAGQTWGGVVLQGPGAAGEFSFCRWRGAETGLSLSNATVEIQDSSMEGCGTAILAVMDSTVGLTRCRLTGNKKGVDVQLRSLFAALDSVFEDHGEYALSLSSGGGGGRISGNRFRRAEVAIIMKSAGNVFLSGNTYTGCTVGIGMEQVGQDIRISGETFDGCPTGIMVLRGSGPWIACCRFINLTDGVYVERFSQPMIANCLFEGNDTGIGAVQKCNFPIRRNIFRKNRRAIYLDLASYAQIHENNFVGNERDVVLGVSMSADYEHRVGTGKVTRQNAQSANSRKIEGVTKEKVYVDYVDAGRNWWGEETTREMEKGGGQANIRSIDDAHDTPEVTYPGWAEGTFKMDRVLYEPWEKAPVAYAGPLSHGCGDLKARGDEIESSLPEIRPPGGGTPGENPSPTPGPTQLPGR